ncbi:MAG: nucleotide exchange factor GrpE [Desulfopila sp.]
MSKEFNDQVVQDDAATLADDVDSSSSGTEEVSENLTEALTAAQAEADDLREKVLRIAAESENFKKRMERERTTALKYAGEQIFREILPVVDNLERAIAHCDEVEGGDVEANFKGLLEGVQLTLKRLVDTLEKFEVKAVASVGEPFDPNHQEALTMEASDSVPANHVKGEFEKGYYYKDRLLRAAKVIVSSGPAQG